MQEVVKFFDRVNLVFMYLAVVGIVVLFGDVLLNVTARKLFHSPIVWSPDLAEYLMVYLAFLPASWLLLRDGHVRVTVVLDKLHGTPRRSSLLASDLVAMFYAGVLAWQSWLVAWDSYVSHVTFSTISSWPEFPIQVIIPIGSGWLCLTAIVKIVAFFGADPRQTLTSTEEAEVLEGEGF